MQSCASLQVWPSSHAEQVEPPQSTSDSFPFWTPSSHAGGVQVPSVQTSETQSCAPSQSWPSSQAEQVEPPQSTSDSSPSRMPLRQLGAPAVDSEELASSPELASPPVVSSPELVSPSPVASVGPELPVLASEAPSDAPPLDEEEGGPPLLMDLKNLRKQK